MKPNYRASRNEVLVQNSRGPYYIRTTRAYTYLPFVRNNFDAMHYYSRIRLVNRNPFILSRSRTKIYVHIRVSFICMRRSDWCIMCDLQRLTFYSGEIFGCRIRELDVFASFDLCATRWALWEVFSISTGMRQNSRQWFNENSVWWMDISNHSCLLCIL